MAVFLIFVISLWLYPILAVYFSSRNEINKIVRITTVSAVLILLAMYVGVSTTSYIFNSFLISTLYFSYSLLLLYTYYRYKNLFVKVVSAILVYGAFVIGYLLGTIGLLGLAMGADEFGPARTIALPDTLIYRQYDSGNATVSISTIDVCLNKKIFPGLEYRLVKKKYNVGMAENPSMPVLNSFNFPVNTIR